MSEPIETQQTHAPTVEHIIRSVISAAKAGQITNHEKDDMTEKWEIISEYGTYVVENINRMSKTQRVFNKTNFYK
ncbi:MAG: hypothetical protein HUJ61_00430, partial [Bacilli bacterium]|nr:hypothetical protein [Bacilli bacterium]